MRFVGRVAIVTGGCGGIGLATARRLASEGARVLIADLTDLGELRAEAARDEGLQIHYQRANVASDEEVAQLVRATTERWGRLDVMVANAGIAGKGTAESTSVEAWRRVLDVNLTGVFLCIKHSVPAIRAAGGGAIVATASVTGCVGHPGALAYASTKGALINMVRAAALDQARDNIRITAVCPGHLENPTAAGGAEARAAHTGGLVARYPLGRLGRADDVASAIAFLASEEASFITGTSLVIDGGYSAQ